ncbi:hypothetical protein FNQ90_07130 [Streptomyces alkaliphilus]|uniref:DUF3987 domain-containing protein n=1 Tax=Streptomyces alkaliphilus TaxID=1472722 RepID=A0A7W3TCC2_9ACTN|nr:DUF3987 domain-containing protein [Streptomyces alkaliphilus]MBB0243885.1 hypothetical protein [Streptomyces alkaliphilus]
MTDPTIAGVMTGHPGEAREPSPVGRPWPTLAPAALHGLPGTIVQTIEPHTEADPAAMLFTLFTAAGAMIGGSPHMLTGGVEHGAKVWTLIIGRTAGGMKGTSFAEIRRVLKAADPEFCTAKVVSGLSSAEGLIQQVRDGSGDDLDSDHFDEGVVDKRLLVIESEFASVLAQGKREGNTLLPVIRQAWDGGTLRTMTLRPKVATDPHIGIVGHITPTELRAKLNEAERAGGTMNRYLPVLSRRSKLLPDGGDLAEAELKAMGASLRAAIDRARSVGRMRRTPEAARHWRDLYKRLAADHAGDGPVAQVVARAAPQVLRLSVTAALLDGSEVIDLPHLQAAEAMWSYAEDSAWWVFGNTSGNPDLDRLKAFVDAGGERGVTRTAIVAECFGRNRKKDQINALWAELLTLGNYEEWSEPTGGRPLMGLRRKKAN